MSVRILNLAKATKAERRSMAGHKAGSENFKRKERRNHELDELFLEKFIDLPFLSETEKHSN